MGCKRNTLNRISAIFLLAVLAGLAAPRNARAVADNVPHTMNFDGYLTDTAGAPLSGTKDMKFGLIVDTTRVWYAEYASVSVISGVFAVVLGDAAQGGISLDPSSGAPQAGTLLPISASVLSTITSASIVTLEVEVYNGALFEALSPSYPVSSALFALKADTVDGYDSTQLAKLDGSGNILSNNGTAVINSTGTWIGPSANIGSGGLTVTAGGAAITGNSNITGTLGVTSSLTAGSITTSGAVNASGKISATAAPTGTGVSNGSFYVNPASATLNNTLFGVAVNGTEKFRVDAEGDTTVGGDLTVTGTISGTVTNATNATNAVNADTVDGIHASASALANTLLALDGFGKFPSSVIDPTGLGSDTVDGFHASATATDGYLYPLGTNNKFPNAVLNTGAGGGLDADTVDNLHAAAFGQLASSNTWSGATNAFSGITASTISASGQLACTAAPAGAAIGDGALYVNPASASANSTLFGVAVGGSQTFKVDAEGDTSVAGLLTSSGGLTVSAGSVSFPAASIAASSISGTVASATNATTVNGISASTTPNANQLLALDGSSKFPVSVITTTGLNSDTVDGIHASTAAEANKLLALDGSGKFPVSVITTTGLDADTVDGLHASDFVSTSASNNFTGTTNTFKEVDISSGSVVKFPSTASNTFSIQNVAGTLKFFENDGTTAACTMSQAGALTVANGLTVSAGGINVTGTVTLPSGSITSTMIADRTIAAADINTGAITANEIATGTITGTQIAPTTITGAKLVNNTITATQMGAGSVTGAVLGTITVMTASGSSGTTSSASAGACTGKAIAGGVSCAAGANPYINTSCPATSAGSCAANAATNPTFWFGQCGTTSGNTVATVYVICLN